MSKNKDFLETVLESEWSPEFIKRMQARMIVSYAKYGAVQQAFPGKVDAVASAAARVARYRETGNTEWLVDAANFLMIEYMLPGHPKAHFRATDADESPGRVRTIGVVDAEPNEDSAQRRLRLRSKREGD